MSIIKKHFNVTTAIPTKTRKFKKRGNKWKIIFGVAYLVISVSYFTYFSLSLILKFIFR